MPFFLILLSLFSAGAFAQTKNHMLIMGGGGEPQEKSTTIFDDDINNVGKFLESSKHWTPKVSFNGGHETTEEIMKYGVTKMAGGNIPFTSDAFEKMISDYERKISSGEIKKGEQILVYLSTHGAAKTKNENSHLIATTGGHSNDLNNLTGAKTVSLDRLEKLIELAEAKGVKLGILDFSCHSGNTLALKKPNTCIIAASGTEHFSYPSYGTRFSKNMKKGKNLEQVFLETFTGRDEPSFPMISTPVGLDINDQIYELMTPYLYWWRPNSGENKLSPFLENQVLNNQCEEANLKVDQLLNLLTELRKVIGPLNKAADRLKLSLTSYHNFQNRIKEELKAMNIQELTKKEKFCTDRLVQFPNANEVQKLCVEWSLKEILSTDHDAMIASYEDFKRSNSSENQKTWYDASIQNLKDAKALKQKFLSQNPSLGNLSDYYKRIPGLQDQTWQLSLAVSKDLQELYSDLYRKRSMKDSRPNPCRKFVL